VLRGPSATLAAVCAAAALAGPAGAATPFPSQRAGSGKEATGGAGVFAGSPYRAASAVVRWDGNLQALSLYLFQQKFVSCASWRSSATTGTLVQVQVARAPRRFVIGQPVAGAIGDFVVHQGSAPAHIVPVFTGVSVTFTRVDTGKNGVWHGSVSIPATTVRAATYSYAGTFAAVWCHEP
jgi:hypothetical protein